MRETFALILLVCCLWGYAAEPDTFIIRGKVGNYQAPAKMYLTYRDADVGLIADSCIIDNGNFYFTGQLSYPAFAWLSLAASGAPASVTATDRLSLYIEPGEMEIKNNYFLYDAKVSGSETNDLFLAYQDLIIPIQKRAEEVQYTFQMASPQQQASLVFKDSLDRVFYALMEEYNRQSLAFIRQHPESILGIYMLQSELNTHPHNPYIETAYLQMSEKVKNTRPGLKLAAAIERSKSLQIGETAPAFVSYGLEGEQIALSDYKGNYVLLVFWSPTCDHCLDNLAELKNIHSLYKDKGLEIISYAVENKNGQYTWKEAIEKNGLEWTNISDLKLWDCDIIKAYKAYEVPANFLIDQEGKIIARELYGDKLYVKMKELFY